MSKIAVIAKVKAIEGKREALVGALQAGLDTAAGEPGTIFYILHEDAADEHTLWVYEMYADQAAVDAHLSSDAYKALGPAIRPFLDGRPELTVVKPIGGKGV